MEPDTRPPARKARLPPAAGEGDAKLPKGADQGYGDLDEEGYNGMGGGHVAHVVDSDVVEVAGRRYSASRDFAALVPDPAIAFPFELDPFQKAAVACIERDESVLVSAHPP